MFICSSVDSHLGYSYYMVVINNAAINIFVQDFVWAYAFSSLGYILRTGIVRSYGNYVSRNSRLFYKVAVPSYIPTSTG